MSPPARDDDRLIRETALWFGGAFMLIAAAAVTAVFALGYGPVFPAVALGVSGLFGITAVCRVREYHPYDRLGRANAVTTLRMGITCLLAGVAAALDPPSQHYARVELATVTMAFGALCLDGIDGPLARRQHMTSRFGGRFDMEVDSLLLVVLSILAWRHDKVGIWVLAIGGFRYAFLVAGLIWPPLQAELPRSMRRKAICAVQGLALCLVLLLPVDRPGGTWIAAAALVTLCVSFAVDAVHLVAMHRRNRYRHRHRHG